MPKVEWERLKLSRKAENRARNAENRASNAKNRARNAENRARNTKNRATTNICKEHLLFLRRL